MGSLRYRRFTQPLLLMTVQRGLLGEFLGRFRKELAETGTALPDAAAPDDAYAGALARLMLAPDGLPFALNEALYAVDEMATPDGRARLLAAFAQERVRLEVEQEASDLEFAIQAWLRAPALFTRKHAELQTSRCCTFEYYVAARPQDRSRTFAPPDAAALASLTAQVDAWYASRHKGIETTSIEVYPFADETWFLVRHGDSYVRALAAERQRRRVIHFRPEKDDLVIYRPALDELRTTARTKGEKDLYREGFGFHLFGDRQYFSSAMAYTLAPLVTEGERVLDTDGLQDVAKIALTELELCMDETDDEITIHKSPDLFERARRSGERLFPDNCSVRRAAFAFQFDDGEAPRTVHICPPNKLRLARGCDADVVHQWLALHGFRTAGGAA